MQEKSNVSTAIWFIPLLAVLLACAFVFIYWLGWVLLRSTASTKDVVPQSDVVQSSVSTKISIPIIPPVPIESEEETLVPQEVLDMEELQTNSSTSQAMPDICPSTTVAVKIKKPSRKVSYTPYENGLRKCKSEDVFPCAWEDKTKNRIKQYWLMSAEGPITRGIYDTEGNLISETIATINGTVTSHTDRNITWYFNGGVLIKVRTSPYDNCNFHDWFFIREDGKQDVCQCAYSVANCCARSPYKESMKRNYCEIFPQDKDFCK